MKPFFLTFRLYAYQRGLPIKPKYLVPSARFSKSGAIPPSLKSNDVYSEYKIPSQEEIQANIFLSLAREYCNKRDIQEAQENLDKAFLLAKSAPENEFSPDLISQMHFLRGYLLVQKKEPKPAYSDFKTFLKLRDSLHTIQDARLSLGIARILMSGRKDPGLEASIENIIERLTHNKTDLEYLILKAQCHQVLSEYHFSIGNPDGAIANGEKCLEVLEASELKNSQFGSKIASMKLEVAKLFIKYYERAYEPSHSSHFHDTLLKIAKIIQENKAELETHRAIFIFVLPKLFELLVKFGNNKEINQKIFGILQEAKFEEKDFSSKNEYIEYLLTVADKRICFEHYTQLWKWS